MGLKRIRLQSEGQRAVWTHTLNQHQKTQDRTALCFKASGFLPWFLDPGFEPGFLLPHLSFPLILRGRAISSWFTSTKSKVSGASLSCCALSSNHQNKL